MRIESRRTIKPFWACAVVALWALGTATATAQVRVHVVAGNQPQQSAVAVEVNGSTTRYENPSGRLTIPGIACRPGILIRVVAHPPLLVPPRDPRPCSLPVTIIPLQPTTFYSALEDLLEPTAYGESPPWRTMAISRAEFELFAARDTIDLGDVALKAHDLSELLMEAGQATQAMRYHALAVETAAERISANFDIEIEGPWLQGTGVTLIPSADAQRLLEFFQREVGLEQTGIWDRGTFEAVSRLSPPTQPELETNGPPESDGERG